eukprot:SAG11_NODE_4305_length_1958_cov_2.754707_3_plen_131_part_00
MLGAAQLPEAAESSSEDDDDDGGGGGANGGGGGGGGGDDDEGGWHTDEEEAQQEDCPELEAVAQGLQPEAEAGGEHVPVAPPPRTAPGVAVSRNSFFVFGGMAETHRGEVAFGDTWRLPLDEALGWNRIG